MQHFSLTAAGLKRRPDRLAQKCGKLPGVGQDMLIRAIIGYIDPFTVEQNQVKLVTVIRVAFAAAHIFGDKLNGMYSGYLGLELGRLLR